MKLRPALAIAPLAILTACGGSAPTYAGLTEYEAAVESLDILARDFKGTGRANPFRKAPPEVVKVVQSDSGEGDDAWVVVLDIAGRRQHMCVWIWADQEVLRTTYNYFVDQCPQKILDAEPGEIAAP